MKRCADDHMVWTKSELLAENRRRRRGEDRIKKCSLSLLLSVSPSLSLCPSGFCGNRCCRMLSLFLASDFPAAAVRHSVCRVASALQLSLQKNKATKTRLASSAGFSLRRRPWLTWHHCRHDVTAEPSEGISVGMGRARSGSEREADAARGQNRTAR